MYAFHIINNAFLIIFILFPLSFFNYDGGDVMDLYIKTSSILLIVSATLYLVNRKNLKTWLISLFLSLVSLLIVLPILFFFLFFGIPPK